MANNCLKILKVTDEKGAGSPNFSTSSRKFTLIIHKRVQAVGKRKCSLCLKTFANKSYLKIHMKNHHTEQKLYHCNFCPTDFKYQSNLAKHVTNIHTKEKPSHASECSKDFSVKAEPVSVKAEPATHSRADLSSSTFFLCTMCLEEFSNLSDLAKHTQAVHVREELYICSECPRGFSRVSLLSLHMRAYHQIAEGLEDFPRKSDLAKHIQAGSVGDKLYQYSDFTKGCDLAPHLRDLPRKNLHKFPEDVKDISKASDLVIQSTDVQASEKPCFYQCAECLKHFLRKAHCARHIRAVHCKERKFECPECWQTFQDKSALVTHMRVHTGERPYPCEVCMKEFKRKTHLDIHMRGHTGEKPYYCAVCKKGFSHKCTLARHIRGHSENN
ncbi:hypothetical protein OTU49_007092 [Cherax quadricarinatus]|uniref:C2H2-type domain-containing protein n=1 Tax=Cherax quadricarinatus TaxID=27406 RepID=A0AAW0WNH5_CHEQU|nr:zinc finger protein 271-like [Cherax quadricarinatus]XP_053639360.1 zinc finger protein 271-like [Cherax quadricarinatus]XP_053639361.1 zinc finger protein 271-like [Cherax quadricarinatus]